MSQIKYRARVAQRRAEARQGNISSFQGQKDIGRIQPPQNTDPGDADSFDDAATAVVIDEAQVKSTAEMLVGLDEDQYHASLTELEQKSPEFYEAVVEELNAMNTQAAAEEGDGFDLSVVAAAATDSNLPAPAPSPQQIAQELATVDEPIYKERLEQLEASDPQLYAAVVAELTSMHSQE